MLHCTDEAQVGAKQLHVSSRGDVLSSSNTLELIPWERPTDPCPLIAPQAPSALVAGAKGPQGSCQSNPKEVARRINGLRRLLGQLYHLSLATLVPPPIHCRIQDSYSEFAQRRPSNA